MPKPDGDGVFAGIVLVAANVFGIGAAVVSQTPESLHAAVVPDALTAEDAQASCPAVMTEDTIMSSVPPGESRHVCRDADGPHSPAPPVHRGTTA